MTTWQEVDQLTAEHPSDSIRTLAAACRPVEAQYRLWVAADKGAAIRCSTDALLNLGQADDRIIDRVSSSEQTFVLIVDAPGVADLTLPEDDAGGVEWVGITASTSRPSHVAKGAVGAITLASDTEYTLYAVIPAAPDPKAMLHGAPRKLGEHRGHLEGRQKWFKKR